MDVRIANREDPDQTASLSLVWICIVCLGCFGRLVFKILEHLPYITFITKKMVCSHKSIVPLLGSNMVHVHKKLQT